MLDSWFSGVTINVANWTPSARRQAAMACGLFTTSARTACCNRDI